MPEYGAIIAGTGSYLPEKRLTNEDLAKMVDTNDQWITQRTGIKERRIAAENESTARWRLPLLAGHWLMRGSKHPIWI